MTADDHRLAWPVGAANVMQGAGFARAMDHGQTALAIVFLALWALSGAALTLLEKPDLDLLDEMTGEPR